MPVPGKVLVGSEQRGEVCESEIAHVAAALVPDASGALLVLVTEGASWYHLSLPNPDNVATTGGHDF